MKISGRDLSKSLKRKQDLKIKLKETLFKEWEGVSEKRVIKKKKGKE